VSHVGVLCVIVLAYVLAPGLYESFTRS